MQNLRWVGNINFCPILSCLWNNVHKIGTVYSPLCSFNVVPECLHHTSFWIYSPSCWEVVKIWKWIGLVLPSLLSFRVQWILPAVSLNFDLLIPKSNQHIYKPKHICGKNGRNSLHCLLRYGVHNVFGSLPAVTLTFKNFWPQNLTSTYVNKNTSMTKIWRNWQKFPSPIFEVWCSQVFDGGTDSQIYSRTDRPEHIMPPVPKVFDDGRIKCRVQHCLLCCALSSLLLLGAIAAHLQNCWCWKQTSVNAGDNWLLMKLVSWQ